VAKRFENVDEVTLEDLKKEAERAGVSKSGTKQEIADRINEQSSPQGAEGKDLSGTKGVDSGNAGQAQDTIKETSRNQTSVSRAEAEAGDAPKPIPGVQEQKPGNEIEINDGDPAGGSPATGKDVGDIEAEKVGTGADYPAAAGEVDPDRKPGEDDLPIAVHAQLTSKEAEAAGKEASVPPSDPRNSVFDHAPGKSLDEAAERRNAHLRGEYQDAVHPKGAWFYTVKDGQSSLIDVAMALGISDHAKLSVVNGIYNGRIDVRPGQKVLLPEDYSFEGIDGAEQAELPEGPLQPPRLAPEEYDNRIDGERLIPEEEQEKLRAE
jgi:hypothetical protein